ncbi:MarR family winged helix-turn-helix transcriptional regulator [Brevibacillus migulae]|uniref:MarR family winged helix-turn-helix transcriptional regulator n=1 Tax=Brevibacillus migulae TaxID=1644114 RepID=UPI00106DE8D7|nr:MarR family transcriptional regulator [Brevibacillus migulae]
MNPVLFRDFANEIIKMSGLLGTEKSFVEGLTPKQVHILLEIGSNIYRHGDLAKVLNVDPSTLTRTLDPLVRAGIVNKELNPANRREVLIQITNKGKTVLKEINGKFDQFFSLILNRVPKEQLDQVGASIQLLLTIIKDMTR